MKEHVSKPGTLHTDNDPVSQPENTVRYALNAVNETNDGDFRERSVEESNERCYEISQDYIILGEVYAGEDKKLIFSVAEDESSSEIGIVDNDCNYNVLVNADFGFKITTQIDATYRLRRGCEHTVYWVDPKPRLINLSDLEQYKTGGNWDIDKFNLFKTYSKIPSFSSISVGENGNIPPGSISFAIQYLDNDFNPTEFIRATEVIRIYNDSLSKEFSNIRGSSNRKSDYQDFGNTNKSVTLNLSNLDDDYSFYRIAIIKADGGAGQITRVEYSQEIPIELPVYTYTGEGVTEGDIKEIQQFSGVIEEVEHIDQLQGKLILSNVKMKQVNYCQFQKYASRIKADLAFKEVILNDVNADSNPKSPTAAIEGTGSMPGEIESYGVVYVFDDGSITPSFHIPGKALSYPSQMSDDNKCQDAFYTDNESCEDYWGVDSEGNPLKNQPIRHHRFPLRSEVNKPLIKSTSTYNKDIDVKILRISVEGEIAPEGDNIEISVGYTIGGVTSVYEKSIDRETFVSPFVFEIADSQDEIVVDSIYEDSVLVDGTSPNGLTYSTETGTTKRKISATQYVAEIFGLTFSNIITPSLEDTNGHQVIGYYIVKNERDDANKTILDSGILLPLMEEPYYTAHGHLAPQGVDNIKQDAFALIHPEHKYLGKEYKNTTSIIQQGEYHVSNSILSGVKTQDVMAGTSYDPEVAKRREKDGDGFTLFNLSRDNELTYRFGQGEYLSNTQLEEVFYLDALNSKAITDSNDERKEIFNVSADNKIGIVTSSIEKTFTASSIPYVVLKRELANPYSNFRYMPYYMASRNLNKFFEGNEQETTTVFAGDVYITPMRYATTFFYDIRTRERDTKSGVWNIIVGALAVIAGAAIAILSGGTALAAAAMVAGFGLSQIATGIKKEQIAKVYSELYEEGLRDCVQDDITEQYFNRNPEDDEVQWVGETLTNVWFESTVNMGLRHGTTMSMPDFLNAPVPPMEVQSDIINDSTKTQLDSYFLEKLTVLDTQAANGRLYQGFANAEIYQFNPDFNRINNGKIYNHLGIEYDCCSDCNEVFPQRTHWSETSFDEELTDNFRVFLPNNYRDIEGSTGEITNIFKMQNNLYLHTERALWHLPENFQERVTGDILSFIGTGEFFNIPPRKIVDDEESSAGTRHKWGMTKSKYGVLFPSVDDKVWYLFNGNKLQPISETDNGNYFEREMPFHVERDYYRANKESYPYINNPSSPFGAGYLSTFDDSKKRFIVTKKDIKLNTDFLGTDYRLCVNGKKLIHFTNYSTLINEQLAKGYTYVGIEDCRLKFKKTIFETVIEQREVISKIPNNTDIHFVLDESGSFGSRDGQYLTEIRQAAENWITQFEQANPDWTGNAYYYYDKNERWLRYGEKIANETYSGQNLQDKDILLVSFCNESSPYGDDGGYGAVLDNPTSEYLEDFEDFKILKSQYKSFIGIHYPIVFENGMWHTPGMNLVQSSIAAIYGTSLTDAEIQSLQRNRAFNDSEWDDLIESLQGPNPYPDDGLKNYGWTGKFNRNNIGTIINPSTFASDINELLSAILTTEVQDFEVRKPRTVYNYIDGQEIDRDDAIKYDNSWTMSYSMKDEGWVSWHSYAPNFFMRNNDSVFSWKYGHNNIWKHNRKNHYLTFYDQKYPHVLEIISKSSPVVNMITDDITLHTKAYQWNEDVHDYNIKRDITFNKALFYNSRQISGVLNMSSTVTDKDYLSNRVKNQAGSITIDNREGDWFVNGFRDMRVEQDIPMFTKEPSAVINSPFTDKTVNPNAVSADKPWFERESFRDKYLCVRLIFDTFDNIKLVTNFSVETEQRSVR